VRPLSPRGAVLLQVAALTQENNALAMAEALRKKNFPAFVLLAVGSAPMTGQTHPIQVSTFDDSLEPLLFEHVLG
jgi:cell division septation protein DedD